MRLAAELGVRRQRVQAVEQLVRGYAAIRGSVPGRARTSRREVTGPKLTDPAAAARLAALIAPAIARAHINEEGCQLD